MKQCLGSFLLALTVSTSFAMAQPVRWTKYSISETGTSVDLPASIFTENAGRPDGYGSAAIAASAVAGAVTRTKRTNHIDFNWYAVNRSDREGRYTRPPHIYRAGDAREKREGRERRRSYK